MCQIQVEENLKSYFHIGWAHTRNMYQQTYIFTVSMIILFKFIILNMTLYVLLGHEDLMT